MDSHRDDFFLATKTGQYDYEGERDDGPWHPRLATGSRT